MSFILQDTFVTEELTYAPGRSLRVMKIPRNLKKAALYSTLCAQHTDAFNVFDVDWLLESHELWEKNMPNVRPYYGEQRSIHIYSVHYHDAFLFRKVELVANVAICDHSILWAFRYA